MTGHFYGKNTSGQPVSSLQYSMGPWEVNIHDLVR
jgi:hypothetical protein